MEKNEIIIGRQVEKGNYVVEEQYKSVGRKHAKLIREPDGIHYIEDLDSANGTFVNGIRVKHSKINRNPSDIITLGGENCYELDLDKALKMFPMTDQDFKDAFLKLEQVYDNYQKAKVNIQSKTQGKMMMQRSLPMAVPGVLIMVFGFISPDTAPVVPVVGVILSAAAIIIGAIWASKSMAKMPVLLHDLLEQFKKEYVCPDPNCGQWFGDLPWQNIKKPGKCRVCGREFNI